jgi:hypothetical protein
MKTQLAALWAFTGESALARIAREWGVQSSSIDKKEGKRVGKRYQKEIEAPTLKVNAPKSTAGKLEHDLDINMAWEVREQARQGWMEPRSKSGVSGFLDTLDDKEYEKRFVLFALQRFMQAVVGGVYVHSVLFFLLTLN